MKGVIKKLILSITMLGLCLGIGLSAVSANGGVTPFSDDSMGGGAKGNATIQGSRSYSTSSGKGTYFFLTYPATGKYSKLYASLTNGKLSNSVDNSVYGGYGNYSIQHTSQAGQTKYTFSPVSNVAGYTVTGASYY